MLKMLTPALEYLLLITKFPWPLTGTSLLNESINYEVEHVWNVMAHTQKPDLVFPGNGRVHLNRRGSQFSQLLAAEVCASAVVMVVMLDTPCS